MVILKISAILAFVIAGAHYVHPGNWHPFAPQGWSGILTGGSIIFFTYIGFDSVSTAAEEARIPQRDLPIGIIATLVGMHRALYCGRNRAYRDRAMAIVARRRRSRGQQPEETGLEHRLEHCCTGSS